MDGLKERIFELASLDEAFAGKLCGAETPEALTEMLKEKGLDVAVEDLEALSQSESTGKVKLSDEELEAVSGGGKCYCVVGGGGTSGGRDETCACVCFGYGKYLRSDGSEDDRCICYTGGVGHSEN